MKAHEVRGLPAEEIKNMLSEAENELFRLRFQHGVGQLENKLLLREKRKEIAILQTVLREEAMKADLIEAKSILDKLGGAFEIPKLGAMLTGERPNRDKARLRQALRLLAAHPRQREFAPQVQTLKKILMK